MSVIIVFKEIWKTQTLLKNFGKLKIKMSKHIITSIHWKRKKRKKLDAGFHFDKIKDIILATNIQYPSDSYT